MAPLRTALAVLWTAVYFSFLSAVVILSGGLLGARFINRWAPVWARTVLRIGGVRLRVIGRERAMEGRSRIFVMNHTSTLDFIVIAALNPPGFTGLVKREFLYMPLIGLVFWLLGMVFIDRKDPVKAREGVRRIGELLRERPRTACVFPEGTRSRTGQLQPFKLGAFHLARETGAPMLPVVCHGAFRLIRPGAPVVVPGEVVLVIQPEIDARGWTAEGVRAEASTLHDQYARWIDEGPPQEGGELIVP